MKITIKTKGLTIVAENFEKIKEVVDIMRFNLSHLFITEDEIDIFLELFKKSGRFPIKIYTQKNNETFLVGNDLELYKTDKINYNVYITCKEDEEKKKYISKKRNIKKKSI